MLKCQTRYFSDSILRFAKKKYEKADPVFLGRSSNNLSLGVVGLANVGKSTFFQSFTRSKLGNPANYPYATIDPSESYATTENKRLDTLAGVYQTQKCTGARLKVIDIAGLTKNAASGEGLGNKFLSDIRQVDGIFHLVRAFVDEGISHVGGNQVDPLRDIIIVTEELILKDIEFVEKGIEENRKLLKKPYTNKGEIENELELLGRLQDLLYDSKKVSMGNWTVKEIEIINRFNFLTAKPTVFLLNVSENDYIRQECEFLRDVEIWLHKNFPKDELVMFSARYESMLDKEEREPYMASYPPSAMPLIFEKMKKALQLISFYTCGHQECREWFIRKGSSVVNAAGLIHTDLEKTFISAQVFKYNDVCKNSSRVPEKPLKLLKYGKNYCPEDNDIIIIEAAKGRSR